MYISKQLTVSIEYPVNPDENLLYYQPIESSSPNHPLIVSIKYEIEIDAT